MLRLCNFIISESFCRPTKIGDSQANFIFKVSDSSVVISNIVDNKSNNIVNILPNLVSDNLIIESSSDEALEFEIVNLTGQIVSIGKVYKKTTITVTDLPSGVYIIKFKSNKFAGCRKIIKK